MGLILTYSILASCMVAAFIRPWIGVVFSYLVAILVPQDIWWWNFEGIRPTFWVTLATSVGFVGSILLGKTDFRTLGNKTNMSLLILWILIVVSYYAGPYVGVPSLYPSYFTWRDPGLILSVVSKIFLLYFVGCMSVNDEKRLKYLVLCLVVSAVYLTYWTNDQYLAGKQIGRIAGPTGRHGFGVYADENGFALVFVTAAPYLFYLGFYFKNVIVRYLLWLTIPFCWHAVFLTGSRGALLGICVTLLLGALRSPVRKLGLLIIPLFIAAYLWQAGDLMRNRAQTVGEYKSEQSAAARLESWDAAIAMMWNHPITGVGLASYVAAFPDHSDKPPREAHNTFFQLGAESGILAGGIYAFIVMSLIGNLWVNGNRLRYDYKEGKTALSYLVSEATLSSMCGFAVCSAFLSLQLCEIFYYLCLVGNAVLFVSRRVKSDEKYEVEREHDSEEVIRHSGKIEPHAL
jgi:putative inorganic carbon (hco3(-)) transporter